MGRCRMRGETREDVRNRAQVPPVDGREGNVLDSAREFAPHGFDAALIMVGNEAAEKALPAMRDGGSVAYPWINQRPAPKTPSTVRLLGYNGNIDGAAVTKLNGMVEAGPFEVHLSKTFKLDEAAEAFRAVGSHHLGRLALLPNS